MNQKKIIKTLLQVSVSSAILWFLFDQIDLAEFWRIATGSDVTMLVFAALIVIFIRFLMAARWQIIITAQGYAIAFRKILKITFVSVIFDRVLPGGIGGDLARGYQMNNILGGGTEQITNVAKTVLIDRIAGVYSMICLALLGGLYIEGPLSSNVIGIAAVTLAISVAWLIRSWFVKTLEQLITCKGKFGKILKKVASIILPLANFNLGTRVLATLLGLSFFIQILRCVLFSVVYMSLGESIDLFHFIYCVPLILIATLIPISVGGLGVREGLLVVYFSQLGVAADISVSAGLIVYVVQGLVVLPGILLLIALPKPALAPTGSNQYVRSGKQSDKSDV